MKGSIVEVSGRISMQPYIGKDGTAKASLNMHCNSIKVHGGNTSSKIRETVLTTGGNAAIENVADITEPMDDIPF